MADDGRAFAVSEEDRAELVRLVNNLLRTTDRLDAQLSTMASMLNEFSNPRSSAKSEAFKELEVTERQHTSGTFLSIFPKALTEIDHSLSQDENQPLTASATAPLHPPPLPKTTIVTDTSPKPQTSQFKNEILPSRNQIEQPGLSAVFPIPHAPPGTPTLITQQTESSSVFLISPTSSSFTALTFKKLPQPVQSWALVQFPDATKLGKETMDELQPHPSHSTLTQPSTHINSAITNLPISSKPDFPLNFLQPNIIRAQDNKSIPPLRDKNCWCALDSKKLLLGAEQITAWRHRLNEGTIFLASLCGRVSLVECVAFDSTEVLVFAGATSGAIKLWDLQEFYPFGEFFVSGFAHKDHGFGVNSIKFIPNGCWVVSGGLDNVGGLDNDNVVSSLLRKFAFNDLKLATRSFRPESLLGEGGFGCVFKGWIEENGTAPARPGTGLTVAVKTLNHDGLQGHKEWLAEVNYLGELVHPNLVKLIGYCIEDDQRLLVYEFMPRGSLENHLFRRSLPLPWSTRMKIALGAAMGLAFLHEEAERPVIYRDFKTSNILLDAVYDAKLSDFGLAKDGPEGDKTHVSTRVMGTYGYAAPEYVMTGHLTSRSDVYSFGVVLLEMITGRRSMDKNRPNGEHNLVEWARPHLGERRRFYRLIDPRLEGHFSIKGAQKAVQLAAHCLSRDPKARPLMSEVVEALKPLPNMKDMASSSYYFQTMQAERTRASPNARNGLAMAGSVPRNGQQWALRSLSMSNGPHASPYHHPHHRYHLSPNPGGRA